MRRPTFAHIDLDNLKSNYRALRAFVTHRSDPGRGVRPPGVIAVIKANAYGHGSVQVARAIQEAEAEAGTDVEVDEGVGAKSPLPLLACADIEEGLELREAGIHAPILVFGALSISDLNGIFESNLIPTVSSPSAARALEAAAAARRCRLHCHLKIDTGMNRFGFRYDNLTATLPEVLGSPSLVFDAVYTHFATAEEPGDQFFVEQRRRFETAVRELEPLGFGPALRHAANSAAMLRDHGIWYDAVRPGLLLFGVVPPPLRAPSGLCLEPVMSLRSRVVTVKGMRVGETSGYGARFTARRPTQVAVVPAGYADGLDVRLAGTGFVLVRGRRVPIVGSVCMDSITVDVTDIEVSPGDEVVVIGAQGDDQIGADDVATEIGTVPHEILCRTGSRIERVYAPGRP